MAFDSCGRLRVGTWRGWVLEDLAGFASYAGGLGGVETVHESDWIQRFRVRVFRVKACRP